MDRRTSRLVAYGALALMLVIVAVVYIVNAVL